MCKLGNVANHSQLDDPFTFSSIYNIVHEIDDTPKNYRAAMHSKQATEWQAAIDAEIKALIELGTWEIVDIPPKVSLKTCAFIFKKKYTGDLVKYKARLVGFKRSITEPCIYKNTIDGHEIIIAIYVDDLIIACDDINIIEKVKQQIASTYKVKDMGEMNWYLGMRFIRNKETNVFTLNQSKYAQDVLDRFAPHYRNSSYRAVPMMPGSNLSPWNENHYASLTMDQYNEVQNFPYRQVVGSLLYLAIWTRPDMAYAVNKVAKHSHNPTLEAVRACKWLLEYLNSTKEKLYHTEATIES